MDLLAKLFLVFREGLNAVFSSPILVMPVCILCVAYLFRIGWRLVEGKY